MIPDRHAWWCDALKDREVKLACNCPGGEFTTTIPEKKRMTDEPICIDCWSHPCSCG